MEKLYSVEVVCTVSETRIIRAKNAKQAKEKVLNGEFISAGNETYENIEFVENAKTIKELPHWAGTVN